MTEQNNEIIHDTEQPASGDLAVSHYPATTEGGSAPLPALPETMGTKAIFDADPYHGMSAVGITADEGKQLAEPLGSDALSIKPDGAVYISHGHLRQRLNEVIGHGQWALMPRWSDFRNDKGMLYRLYSLIVRGAFAAEAIGEMQYHEANKNMTWGDAAEGCKSNALMRCCKDLGIGLQCWDKLHNEQFQKDHCIFVFVKQRDGKVKPQWRRKDSSPFYGETGPVPDAGPAVKQPQARQQAPQQPRQAANAPKSDQAPAQNGGQAQKPPIGPIWGEAQIVRVDAVPAQNQATCYKVEFETRRGTQHASTFSQSLGNELTQIADMEPKPWAWLQLKQNARRFWQIEAISEEAPEGVGQ